MYKSDSVPEMHEVVFQTLGGKPYKKFLVAGKPSLSLHEVDALVMQWENIPNYMVVQLFHYADQLLTSRNDGDNSIITVWKR